MWSQRSPPRCSAWPIPPRYGTKRTICRINHAIMHIGLDETLSLMTFSLMRTSLPKEFKVAGFSIDQYWMHSWICAHAASLMGRPQFLVRSLPGELYMAGLLHDVGKIVLATYLPEDFSRCLEISKNERIPLYQIERDILGVDHALLGGAYVQPMASAGAHPQCRLLPPYAGSGEPTVSGNRRLDPDGRSDRQAIDGESGRSRQSAGLVLQLDRSRRKNIPLLRGNTGWFIGGNQGHDRSQDGYSA